MGDPITVDLFAEDQAHEEFIKAIVDRLAAEEQKVISLRVRSARSGHGRALGELSLYQRAVIEGLAGLTRPDLLVVAIDANCKRVAAAKKEITEKIDSSLRNQTVVACPDPHIERWYVADPDSFAQVVGARPKLGRKKCERGYYKSILSGTLASAGHPTTLGGIEFAPELVAAMDLHRAGKTERTLKDFVQDARNAIRTIAPRRGGQ
jgi:hypothetical protein